MKKKLIWLLTGIVLLSLLVGCTPGAASTQIADGATDSPSATTVHGIPPVHSTPGMPAVIVLSGSNYEMGYQYGVQLAPLIYRSSRIVKEMLIPVLGEETVIKDMQVCAYYADKYDPHHREWLEGMSAGCKKKGYDISYEELLLILLYPTELWLRPEAPYPEEAGVKSKGKVSANPAGAEGYHACTSLAATGSATVDGKPVVAVSGGATKDILERLIVIALPDEGPSFVTFAPVGGIHHQMGMNSSGFAWVPTANYSTDPPWGLMIEFHFHYLTQYCESSAEAQQWIEESVPRSGVCGNFTMTDATGDIFVVETNADCYLVREPGDLGETAPFLVNTNHFAAPETRDCNPPGWESWNFDSLCRYATSWQYVSAAAEKGEIDFEFLREMYHSDDWYDPTTNTWHYNDPGSGCGFDILGYTQHSIFFPADLTAYFMQGTGSGTGIPAGATGEFVKVRLADDSATVAANADADAYAFYKEARTLLRTELNINAELDRSDRYLTYSIAQSIEEMLDEAWAEYERGMDRVAFAYQAESEGADVNEQVALWSEALTHYAKTQLYAQMVTTRLEALAE